MSIKKSDYYIYGYKNPLKQNEYFYIGFSGDEKRWLYHLEEAKKFIRQNKSNKWIDENADNPHKTKTIIKILRADLEPNIVKISENMVKRKALNEEIRLIALHGRADKGLGTLTNMTDGGEGSNGGSQIIDISGQIFGKLLVLEFSKKDKWGAAMWLCKCDCGNEKIIRAKQLKNNSTRTCGCSQKESKNVKHGLAKSPIYVIWKQMKRCCYNTNFPAYKKYGANGIKVCDRWLDSFENFYEDMGERPSDKHTLGRIDVNENYELSNCKWIVHNIQQISINKETKTIHEWFKISGTPYSTILNRIKRKWSPEEAVFGRP